VKCWINKSKRQLHLPAVLNLWLDDADKGNMSERLSPASDEVQRTMLRNVVDEVAELRLRLDQRDLLTPDDPASLVQAQLIREGIEEAEVSALRRLRQGSDTGRASVVSKPVGPASL